MYDRLAKLVQRLHEKSRRGEIAWRKNASGNFEASFPSYTIEVYSLPYGQGLWGVRIFNEDGEFVEGVNDYDLSQHVPGQPWEDVLREIYNIARRKALRVDEALDELIVELEK
jgi:hypothetical protein